jgi:hypothetical protein
MRPVMSFDVHSPAFNPARYAPPPVAMNAVTLRDMAAAARVGVQAVPVRQLDPATGPAKREKASDAVNERKAMSDADRLEMLRWAALRRDAGAITGH